MIINDSISEPDKNLTSIICDTSFFLKLNLNAKSPSEIFFNEKSLFISISDSAFLELKEKKNVDDKLYNEIAIISSGKTYFDEFVSYYKDTWFILRKCTDDYYDEKVLYGDKKNEPTSRCIDLINFYQFSYVGIDTNFKSYNIHEVAVLPYKYSIQNSIVGKSSTINNDSEFFLSAFLFNDNKALIGFQLTKGYKKYVYFFS